jgi:hypothetical protein
MKIKKSQKYIVGVMGITDMLSEVMESDLAKELNDKFENGEVIEVSQEVFEKLDGLKWCEIEEVENEY